MANRVAFLPVAVPLLLLASPPATAAPAAAARTLELPDDKAVAVAWSGSHFLLTYRHGFGPADGWFVVLDRDGKEVYRRYPARDIPDHARQFAFEGGLTASGRLMVTANDGTESAALVYDIGSPEAGPVKVWRSSNATCMNAAVGANGCFWCLGGEVAEMNRDDDFRVLHLATAVAAARGRELGPRRQLRAVRPWPRRPGPRRCSANGANDHPDLQPGPCPIGGQDGQAQLLAEGQAGTISERQAARPRLRPQETGRPRRGLVELMHRQGERDDGGTDVAFGHALLG
jgi:hypothetical protein